jgi:hypothetical protein
VIHIFAWLSDFQHAPICRGCCFWLRAGWQRNSLFDQARQSGLPSVVHYQIRVRAGDVKFLSGIRNVKLLALSFIAGTTMKLGANGQFE